MVSLFFCFVLFCFCWLYPWKPWNNRLLLMLLQINLEKCILCQKKTSSEYLSSGEIGRSNIASLAKIAENDPRASRVLQLTAQEQGIIKYHTSSCYRNFMRDMAKPDSIAAVPEQSEPSQPEPTSEPRTKRFKASVTGNVCIFLWCRSKYS